MKRRIALVLVSIFCMMGVMSFSLSSTIPQVAAQVTGTGSGPTDGQNVQQGLNDVGGAFPGGATQQTDIRALLHTIINWALYLAAVIAVLFIIYGGFLYITSGGDAAQAKKGTQSLTNAVIGLVIVVLSYLIVQVVYNFLVNRT